jgi:hypothetical protein
MFHPYLDKIMMEGAKIRSWGQLNQTIYREGTMNFTLKDWIALAVSSVFTFAVFGNISSKAGYPRWHGLIMAIPFVSVIALLFFAYSTWPIESKLLRLELAGPTQASSWDKT